MNQEPKHIKNEYYIEEDYAWLAGPFDMNVKNHKTMLDNVVADMKKSSIDYRVVKDARERFLVERKGMILPKRS